MERKIFMTFISPDINPVKKTHRPSEDIAVEGTVGRLEAVRRAQEEKARQETEVVARRAAGLPEPVTGATATVDAATEARIIIAEARERARIETEARATEAEARARIVTEARERSERRGVRSELEYLDTPFKAREWVEDQLRGVERVRDKIERNVLDDLLDDISKKIPNQPEYSWCNPETGMEEGLKGELKLLVRARIFAHNAAFHTNKDTDQFATEFGKLRRAEYLMIFATDGFDEATRLLLNYGGGEGDFFRLDNKLDDDPAKNKKADAARNQMRTQLKDELSNKLRADLVTELINADPGVPLTENEAKADRMITNKAELALELAEKTAHFFMASAYYDGLRDGTGNYIGPDVEEMKNKTGDTSEKRQERVVKAYARFIEDNYDGRIGSKESLSGQGCLMKNVLFAPIRYKKEEEGRVDSLRRYCYLYVTDAIHSLSGKAEGAVPEINNLVDLIEAIKADEVSVKNLNIWAGRVAEASKNRKVFFDEGDDSVLNQPLVDPDKVELEGPEKGIPAALENYKKAFKGFHHLSDSMGQYAMSRLLKGVLKYVNASNDIHKEDGFEWRYKWSQETLLKVLQQMVGTGRISLTQANDLESKEELKISREIAALETFGRGVGPALGAGLRAFFSAVTKK